jgi:hypothetical protein
MQILNNPQIESKKNDYVFIYNGKILDRNLDKGLESVLVYPRLKGGIPVLASGLVNTITVEPGEIVADAAAMSADAAKHTSNFLQKILQFFTRNAQTAAARSRGILEFIKNTRNAMIKLAKTFAMVARFYPIILVALIILAFFGQPLEYIMLFISGIIVSILWVFVYILGLPIINIIPYTLYFLAVYFLPLMAYTIILIIVFLIVTLLCGVLAALNVATGGSLNKWLICDNSPTSWYTTSSYHLDNKYRRSFFCGKPCGARYEPDGDSNCKKVDSSQPSFCPQAEIMRIYSGNKNDSVPHFLDYNTTDPLFTLKTSKERKELLKEHYMKKMTFLNNCSGPLKTYNNVSLNICANLDNFEKNETFNKGYIEKMRIVCKQAYCNSGTNYPFCSVKANAETNDPSILIKQIIKIIALTLVFVILILFIFATIFKISLFPNKLTFYPQ